jgi:hypothetical protein
MLPIPKHLIPVLKPIGDANNEFKVTGKIVCNCGSENFAIEFVGDDSEYEKDKVIKTAEIDGNYYLIVKVKCNRCSKEFLIFDKDFHGWNGFVCGGDTKGLTRPEAKNWHCNKCFQTNHSMTVEIQSEGQKDFIEEAGEEFEKDDWVEGFGWITIKIECKSCKEINDDWISYETM